MYSNFTLISTTLFDCILNQAIYHSKKHWTRKYNDTFLEYKPFDQNQFGSFDSFITNKNQTRFGKITFGAFSRILLNHLEKYLSKNVFIPIARHFPSIKYSIISTIIPRKNYYEILMRIV